MTHAPPRVPTPPKPHAATAPEGMKKGREMSQRYLPDAALLWAALAFAPESPASPFLRAKCAQLLAAVAGALPQPAPPVTLPVALSHDENNETSDDR